MSTISVKDRTKEIIEAEARKRGVAVPDYVEMVVEHFCATDVDDSQRQDELRRRLTARIALSASQTPAPNEPAGLGGDFARAMVEKFRGRA